ncbi:MAG: response regulator [Planctomycetota bacterium]
MPSVLLVDDDVNLLRGLRRNLRNQPYDLYTANCAEMARDMFVRRPFDLVVVDQMMSGASGTDLIAWIASDFPDTVRIMLTGQADPSVMLTAINQGEVFRYLTKPCHELELAIAILDGLERRLEKSGLS